MELKELRAERARLCAKINELDKEVRVAAREKGATWRRLYAQRKAFWSRLNAVESRMVLHYLESGASNRG